MMQIITEFTPEPVAGVIAEFTPEPVAGVIAGFRQNSSTQTPLPCWLLLRGLIREQRHWGDFPRRLADRLNARVLCVDLPGNGQRYREPSPPQLTALLAQVRQHLAAQLPGTLSQPINLLGLSMGGMIATVWARRYPQQVQSLVLINSSFGDLSPPWRRIRPAALARLLGALMRTIESREQIIYDLTCSRSDIRDLTLEAWVRYARDCPVSLANFLRQLLASAGCRNGRGRPTPPALILTSDDDRLVNPTCSKAIAQHWQARLLRHPSAGHDLPHDDPDWVLEQIQRWLQARA
jgi:pimeloyl-ACP methyl ester carboxylesterase